MIPGRIHHVSSLVAVAAAINRDVCDLSHKFAPFLFQLWMKSDVFCLCIHKHLFRPYKSFIVFERTLFFKGHLLSRMLHIENCQNDSLLQVEALQRWDQACDVDHGWTGRSTQGYARAGEIHQHIPWHSARLLMHNSTWRVSKTNLFYCRTLTSRVWELWLVDTVSARASTKHGCKSNFSSPHFFTSLQNIASEI